MDRMALSRRLEGLSKVFVAGSPYHRDLKAMAEVLAKVDDEKFATILDANFKDDASDVEATVFSMPFPDPKHPRTPQHSFRSQPSRGKGILTPEKIMKWLESMNPQERSEIERRIERVVPEVGTGAKQPVQAPANVPGTMAQEASDKNVGLFWNREASEAIRDNLLRDVLGMTNAQIKDTNRHLDKDQIPDGTHDGERASNLKSKQTPKLSDVLDSDIVNKSHGKVRKEAGSIKGPGIPDGTGPHGGTARCQMSKKEKDEDKEAALKLSPAQRAEQEAKKQKAQEEAEKWSKKTEKSLKEVSKAEKKLESEKKKDAPAREPKNKKEANLVEGIELTAPMDNITLDVAEQDKLSKLFA